MGSQGPKLSSSGQQSLNRLGLAQADLCWVHKSFCWFCRAPAHFSVIERLESDSVCFEPGHEKMCLISYANNKGADQPAHPRSLISAFVVRCLDSIISLDSIDEISRL